MSRRMHRSEMGNPQLAKDEIADSAKRLFAAMPHWDEKAKAVAERLGTVEQMRERMTAVGVRI